MPKIWQNLKNITDSLSNMDPRDASASNKCLVSLSCSNLQATVKYSNCLKQFLKNWSISKNSIFYSVIYYVKFWNWNNFVYRESCSAERLVEVAWLPDRAPKLWNLAISRSGEHGGKFGEHGKYQPDDLKHSACFEMLRDLRGNNTSVLWYCMYEGLKFL